MFGFGVLYLCRGRDARYSFESGVSVFSTPNHRYENVAKRRKVRPMIDTGRVVPFSQILRNRDFESKENRGAFLALLPQTSRTHPTNLPEHPLHRRSEIVAVPDGHRV